MVGMSSHFLNQANPYSHVWGLLPEVVPDPVKLTTLELTATVMDVPTLGTKPLPYRCVCQYFVTDTIKELMPGGLAHQGTQRH